MNNLYPKIKEFLLDLLFPRFCFGCQKEGVYLCDDCKETLDILKFDCNSHCKNLSGLSFALSYKERALTKELIRKFKYEPHVKDLAKTLALLIAEHLILSGKNKNEFWKNSVLIPIPLDKRKLKLRGYNQSEELAKELSKILQVLLLSDILIKIKPTKEQVGLSAEQRRTNLLGAFAIKNCATPDVAQFSGKRVFLVDDVYTTGSTMEECAFVLKQAGAKSVWGIAIAREG